MTNHDIRVLLSEIHTAVTPSKMGTKQQPKRRKID